MNNKAKWIAKLMLTLKLYSITVSEGVKPGTLVTKLNVEYDKKLSNNIHFHYKIIEGNRKDYFGVTRYEEFPF